MPDVKHIDGNIVKWGTWNWIYKRNFWWQTRKRCFVVIIHSLGVSFLSAWKSHWFSILTISFSVNQWINEYHHVSEKNWTWSEPWWIVSWPNAYPAWQTVSWPNSKNWAENTRLPCGWPRTPGLNGCHAIAKRRDMPMIAWQTWQHNGSVLLSRHAIRNCGDESEKYREFPACTSVDTNIP